MYVYKINKRHFIPHLHNYIRACLKKYMMVICFRYSPEASCGFTLNIQEFQKSPWLKNTNSNE